MQGAATAGGIAALSAAGNIGVVLDHCKLERAGAGSMSALALRRRRASASISGLEQAQIDAYPDFIERVNRRRKLKCGRPSKLGRRAARRRIITAKPI